MKRLVLGLLVALAIPALGGAQAATYTLNTNAGQEAVITDARTRYNNSIPATVDDGTPAHNQVANPALKATNTAFVNMVLGNALTTWDGQAARPSLSVTEKNASITMLQAAVGRADGNSAAAQNLLDKLNASQ